MTFMLRRALGAILLTLLALPLGAETIVNIGEIREFNGPDDLELDPARVVVAIDIFGDSDRTVNGVLFETDKSPPANVSVTATHSIDGWASLPSYGGADPTSANNLELIMQDIRWSLAPAGITLEVGGLNSGVEYELQMLFNEGRSNDRRWDIGIEGELAVDDFSSQGEGTWNTGNGFAYIAPFSLAAGDTTLNVELKQHIGGQAAMGSDNNPILQAFTVTEITVPLTPESLDLSPLEFFATQSSPIGTFSTVDLKRSANHLYSLADGGADNSKFTISDNQLTPDELYDFSGHAPGTTFDVRIRTTDADDPTRFLEQDFTLTLAQPIAPDNLFLSATSISSGAIVGTPVGTLTSSDANAIDGHTYELIPGAGDSDNALFSIAEDVLKVAAPIPGARTSVTLRLQSTDRAGLRIEKTFTLDVTEPSLRLNEVVASNGSSLLDEDDTASDWIEIFNEQAGSASLNGWHLSDDQNDLTKWTFPAVSIGPNEFLVVFASAKDRSPVNGDNLHTNFQLSGGGETLFLVKPDGVTIASQLQFPEVYPDVSYGQDGNNNETGFLQSTTPGAANSSIAANLKNEVFFSRERGLYDTAFQLELTATVPGSTIRYTTNGQKPTAVSGSLYTGPINVTPETGTSTRGTRRIRAIAVHPTAAISPVATHTYLWVNGVTNEQNDGILGQSVFKAAIKNHATYGPEMDDGLLALPVVSIVKSGGVSSTEQEMSMELISNDGSEPGFQINAGVKIVGGASVGSAKNNWRCYFRSEYGASKLRYPVFAREPYSSHTDNDEFDLLQLRGGSHDNFYWMALPSNQSNGAYRAGDALYVRNRWISDMEMIMGHTSLHGRYVHCYINGTYHGLYHLHERPMHHYMDKYFGGDAEDYHYTNSGRTGSDHDNGDLWSTAWNNVKSAAATGGQASKDWINWESLADNQLLYFYCGNDWDWTTQHNWMAAGPKRPGEGGWQFYSWDCDVMLYDVIANNLDQTAPDGVFNALMNDEDFKVFFRDRVYKYCFHEGLLTPGGPTPSFEYRMNEISSALVPETARWQPTSAVSLPWDRDGEWRNEWDYVTDVYFAQRTDILLDQLRSRGWYPVEAPEFEPHGGEIEAGHSPILTSGPGTIYLTTDGSDPRLPGGTVNPKAIAFNGSETSTTLIDQEETWSYLDNGFDQGTAWRTPGFDDSSWSTGQAEFGYGDGAEGAEGTVVDFGGDFANKFITTYFRKKFTVNDVANITGLQLGLRRDDGAVVYLNGTEVWRNGMPENGPITFTTPATNAAGGDDETIFHQFNDLPLALLAKGTNTIAVEVHQNAATSSDISFDLELRATQPSDPSQLALNESTLVRARVLSGNDWSPVNSVRYLIGTPASAANLVVSEFSYRPAKASPTEDPDNIYSRTDFEFIELRNISNAPIHLDGVRLTDGVTFDFAEATNFSIAAGETLLIVENQDAFFARYPDVPASRIAGEYSGNLSNDGERIEILGADNLIIQAFTYNDQRPWPTAADGGGFSLELVEPSTSPDHNTGQNWLASRGVHGTPADLITPMDFETWRTWVFSDEDLANAAISGPHADPDGDGWSNFAEFALGLAPLDSRDPANLVRTGVHTDNGEDYLSLTFETWSGASGVTTTLQVSPDLTDWLDLGFELLPSTDNGDGTTTRTFLSPSPLESSPREFIRLRFHN
ncbi:lamin tail domain-containing protein [Verrucomicrobiaceae bacterium 227]